MLEKITSELIEKDPQKVSERIKEMLKDGRLIKEEREELLLVIEKIRSSENEIINSSIQELKDFAFKNGYTGFVAKLEKKYQRTGDKTISKKGPQERIKEISAEEIQYLISEAGKKALEINKPVKVRGNELYVRPDGSTTNMLSGEESNLQIQGSSFPKTQAGIYSTPTKALDQDTKGVSPIPNRSHKIQELGINEIPKGYEGMRKVTIIVNGKEKDIWIDNENLRVDSSNWKKKEIGGVIVKINPEGDIIEYLEGELAGQQLFTRQAAKREANKLGKRLPGIIEFESIIEKVGKVGIEEFMKLFPGFRYSDGSGFSDRGDIAYFWSSSVFGGDACIMSFIRGCSNSNRYWNPSLSGLSVRLVKD